VSAVAGGAEANKLCVERIATTDDLDALESEWRQLFYSSGLDLFNAWEWMASWWHHFCGERALWVLVARDATGGTRGIVPMSLGVQRVGLMRVRRLGFLGEDTVGSDYLDVIAAPEDRPAVIAAVAGYLTRHRNDWDLLEWRDMDAQSPSAQELSASLGAGFCTARRPEIACPGQSLAPDETFDAFLSGTSRSSNYRRRLKWLQNQPGFRIDRCEGGPGLEAARASFFHLHQQRWAEVGGSSGIPDARVRAFHEEATRRLAGRGCVVFYMLWVRGQQVASVYALIHAGTFYYYQAGMDPAWRSKSVGLVLIGETFADAIRRKIRRYDFLRGEEPYKFDWVGERRQLVSWRLFPASGPGRLACLSEAGIRAAKRGVRTLMPARTSPR